MASRNEVLADLLKSNADHRKVAPPDGPLRFGGGPFIMGHFAVLVSNVMTRPRINTSITKRGSFVRFVEFVDRVFPPIQNGRTVMVVTRTRKIMSDAKLQTY